MSNYNEGKKTVSNIIIDRFLKDVEEKGKMPWQRPYERYNAFNYFTKQPYRGINRLMLPFGEYMTKNQITQYNIDKGYVVLDEKGKVKEIKPEAYRFQKGIMWIPVVFFRKDERKVSTDEIKEAFPDFNNYAYEGQVKYIGRKEAWTYFMNDKGFFKTRNILRFYEVADRKFFRNENGDCLPSRIETGEVVITKQNPKTVFDNYISRSGVKLDTDYKDTPCYIPFLDEIKLNPLHKNEDSWFSCAFHEAAHSTGAFNRLNRIGVVGKDCGDKASEEYAKEEVIAEICAYLCCAETGVYTFETSGSSEYDNNLAYVRAWKSRIKEWGKEFIFLVSQADKAFNYICSNPDDEIPDTGENESL